MKEKIKQWIKELYGSIFFYLFRIFPIDEKKVFFSSFHGRNCEGNPRYVSIYLHENRKDIKQVWSSRENNKIELWKNMKKVNWGSIKMIYEMATSKVWVDSHSVPTWIKKRKNQVFIQLWHGGLGMKKIVNDFAGLTKEYEKMISHGSKIANLFVSNSKFLTNIYRNAFKYNGEILEIGFPKNDIFYSSTDNINKIRKEVIDKLGISSNKKIALYAPTFRENRRLDVYNIDLKLLKEALEQRFKEEFIVLFRLHVDVRHLSKDFQEKNPECIDASYYDNMQDLIIATDVFITDYSSGIFDFASLRRPGFLFASDINEYEKERGLYYDLRDLPFPLAQTNEELKNNIINFKEDEYKTNLEDFFLEVGLKDNSSSTEKVSKIIENYLNK